MNLILDFRIGLSKDVALLAFLDPSQTLMCLQLEQLIDAIPDNS